MELTDPGTAGIIVRMLGPFSVSVGGRAAGPWPRPSARRLCALVLLSPGRLVSRDLACEELFPGHSPRSAARSLSKALSMAHAALAPLGTHGMSLLSADLSSISGAADAWVDVEAQIRALHDGLRMAPGPGRDAALTAALGDEGELLADEPYADWALRPRDRLEALRQEARLALARDRSSGSGRAGPGMIVSAWQAAFEHDEACEEAAIALIAHYMAAGRRELAARVYRRCSLALSEIGLRTSASLDQSYREVRGLALSQLDELPRLASHAAI